MHGASTLRTGRVLKEGEAATAEATRWGDLAGASVDIAKDGGENRGVWIFHEHARMDHSYGTLVGKVFGGSYK